MLYSIHRTSVFLYLYTHLSLSLSLSLSSLLLPRKLLGPSTSPPPLCIHLSLPPPLLDIIRSRGYASTMYIVHTCVTPFCSCAFIHRGLNFAWKLRRTEFPCFVLYLAMTAAAYRRVSRLLCAPLYRLRAICLSRVDHDIFISGPRIFTH